MRKLIPILLLGLFLQEKIQAQCNPAFDTSVTGATIQLQALDTGLYTFHNWKFGDGTYGWGANVLHTYSLPGTYVVKHIIFDSLNNCRDSAQQTITISFTASCAASFSAKQDSIIPNRYYFYSTSTVGGGSIQSYKWTVNGDSVSSAPTFNRLLNPGFNLVCLAIKTTAGCTSSTCDSIYVDTTGIDTTGNCNWSAFFTYSYNPANTAQVSFSPTPLIPGLSYYWNFGDGFVSYLQSPTHLYSNPGTYSVILTIIDSAAGCFDTARRSVIIVPKPDSCKASFIAVKDSVSPNNYYFYSTSTAGGGSIQSYKWMVNGDSVSSAPTFNQLLDPGFNLVCLIIKTAAGCRSSKCDSIYVDTTGIDTTGNCNWSPSFTYTVNPSQPNQYAFTAVSSDTVVLSYHWMIQPCDSTSTDSVTYNTANPVHTFTSPGCYRVCLHLLTLNGCKKSYCDTISVNYSLAAGFVTSFPNPVQAGHVQLRLDLVQPAKVKITVFNSFGHSVYTNEKAYGTGQSRISVPVDKLQRGLYYIDIQYGNNRKRSVFQKL